VSVGYLTPPAPPLKLWVRLVRFVQNVYNVPTLERVPSSKSYTQGVGMEHITTAEARKQMAELLNRAAYGKERFVVTRHGKELVAIVPLEEISLLDKLRALLSKKDFEAALQEVQDGDTRSWTDVRRDLDV